MPISGSKKTTTNNWLISQYSSHIFSDDPANMVQTTFNNIQLQIVSLHWRHDIPLSAAVRAGNFSKIQLKTKNNYKKVKSSHE